MRSYVGSASTLSHDRPQVTLGSDGEIWIRIKNSTTSISTTSISFDFEAARHVVEEMLTLLKEKEES